MTDEDELHFRVDEFDGRDGGKIYKCGIAAKRGDYFGHGPTPCDAFWAAMYRWSSDPPWPKRVEYKPVWQGLCYDGWEDFDSEDECLRYTKAVLGGEWSEERVRFALVAEKA